MKSYLLISGFLLLAGTGAKAQDMTPIAPSPAALEKQEIACRTKAKEEAAKAFRSCMVETKSTQIEQIRKEYQEKLSKIKADYELELGRVSGKASKKAEMAPAVKEIPAIEIKSEGAKKEGLWTGDFSRTSLPVSPVKNTDKLADRGHKMNLPAGKSIGKAMLFNDKSEAPEPIPVEAMSSSYTGE